MSSLNPPFPTSFKGEIVTQYSPEYPDAIARWAVNAERKAKVVTFVTDTADVAISIEYARKHGLPIAVCCGGHNAAGASSSEDGLVIDLRRHFNTARVDNDAKLAYVGGGAIWETVDKAAIEHGLATVGGTINHTGVAGLTLGGGYGFLTGRHGLTIDNLESVTMVTASGSVLTANETENPDLFFAVRGGGSNFGVVTEFVFRLHPQRRTVYAGMVFFTPTALEQLVSAVDTWWSHRSEDEVMMFFMLHGPDKQPALAAILFYNGSEEEGRRKFKPIFDIGPVFDQTREIPYEELNALQNAFSVHGNGSYFKGLARRTLDLPSLKEAFAYIWQLAGGPHNPTVMFECIPLEVMMQHKSGAFRRQDAQNIVCNVIWRREDDSSDTRDQARTIAYQLDEIFRRGQPQLTTSEKQGYSNYDDQAALGSKDLLYDRAKKTFAENYERLQAIKKKYDPDMVFMKWCPIIPA